MNAVYFGPKNNLRSVGSLECKLSHGTPYPVWCIIQNICFPPFVFISIIQSDKRSLHPSRKLPGVGQGLCLSRRMWGGQSVRGLKKLIYFLLLLFSKVGDCAFTREYSLLYDRVPKWESHRTLHYEWSLLDKVWIPVMEKYYTCHFYRHETKLLHPDCREKKLDQNHQNRTK